MEVKGGLAKTRAGFVYSFGAGVADGDGSMKDLLGGKGAGLAEMTSAGLPVPPGFTVSTEVCSRYEQNKSLPPEIETEIEAALVQLENLRGERLGWRRLARFCVKTIDIKNISYSLLNTSSKTEIKK